MRAYSLLLIKTCHRRGIFAMGGMSAQIPVKNNPQANEAALHKVPPKLCSRTLQLQALIQTASAFAMLSESSDVEHKGGRGDATRRSERTRSKGGGQAIMAPGRLTQSMYTS